jgi:hypothetical protein
LSSTFRGSGRRVMPGVRPLLLNRKEKVMNGYVVALDINSLPPDGSFQKSFLAQVEMTYHIHDEPRDFAVYERLHGDVMLAYYFSSVAAELCKTLIDNNSGVVMEKSLPDGAVLKVGKESGGGV